MRPAGDCRHSSGFDERLLRNQQDPAAEFRVIRTEVLRTIDATLGDKDDPHGAERRKQLTKIEAERFLEPVGTVVGVKPDKLDPSAAS